LRHSKLVFLAIWNHFLRRPPANSNPWVLFPWFVFKNTLFPYIVFKNTFKNAIYQMNWIISRKLFSYHSDVGKVCFLYSWAVLPKSFPKPNSWIYNFVEVSGHHFESSQTWGFRIQCSHYKPVSNHFAWGGGGGGNPLVEVTVKGGKLLIIFPNNVQEFVLIFVGSNRRAKSFWQNTIFFK
jgi:hypothetical protein